MQQTTSNIQKLRMQALSILPMPHPFLDFDDFAPIPEKLEPDFTVEHQIHDDNEGNVEEQEFSFVCSHPQGTFMFADEIFDNGQVKQIFPVFNKPLLFSATIQNTASPLRPPLKKLFVEECNIFCLESNNISNEPENEPLKNTMMLEADAPNEGCKKNNSTGFSKLWRFRRDLKIRSNSDSKDAFVFLNPPITTKSNESKLQNVVTKKGKGEKKRKVILSAHEKLYVMNRTRKESSKRRSFLPYRQQLVGFFANVNGFSKNLHPF